MAHTVHGVGAPPAVDVEGEQVIGQVVPGCHAAEHTPYPTGGFLLVARTVGRSTVGLSPLHARARPMASSTSFSSMPDTTVTSPMRTGSTKCTLPCTVFLSCTRRAAKIGRAS